MTTKNEWSQLKKLIVGIADEAKIPEIDLSMRTINYADKLDISNVPVGNYPEQVIEEANEDLETLKITDCEKATAVDISLPLDAYKKNLSAVNKLWKAIVENTAQKVKVEDQKSTLISLTKNVCHE